MRESYILNIQCPDQQGLVAAIAGCLAKLGCNITRSMQFEDPLTSQFFMRVCFDSDEDSATRKSIAEAFSPVGQKYDMEWTLSSTNSKQRMLVMVSKASHCLVDLLHRHQIGSLPVEIPAIVSNHPDLAPLAEYHKIPYHHIPITKNTKLEQEAHLLELIEQTKTDVVVLARYMQVLTDNFCAAMSGRVINIHHSFLPSFKGAKPYHQAYERGVKMIGATAHYVTADLDEGPIIAQETQAVGHEHSAEDLVRIGRDIEAFTLARAVQAHAEHRVMLNGVRTVVFR